MIFYKKLVKMSIIGFIVAILTLCQAVLPSEGHVERVVSSNCSYPSLGSGMAQSIDTLEGNLPPCFVVDQAMSELVSNSVLYLEQGMHFVTRSHVVYDMNNISLIGMHEGGVHLTCDRNTGFGFVNVTGLAIANVTINGCGLDEYSLQNAMDSLRQIVDVWSSVPHTLRVGLFLGHCHDLSMFHVNVNGTNGMGMLVINMVGNSVLSHVNFTHNVRPSCQHPVNVTSKFANQIGGGAYFLYHDYLNESDYDLVNSTLSISDSYFAYNADCSFSTQTHLNYKYLGNQTVPFTVGAGGGLSIMYGHSYYSLVTNVDSTIFYRNDAWYGSGAYVGTFADFVCQNQVVFNDCTFKENGLASAVSDGGFSKAYCRSGAGLAVFTDLLKPANAEKTISHIESVSISVLNTEFIRNKAEIEGGGLFAYSLVNSPHRVNSLQHDDYFNIEWKVASCTFRENQARLGSAASFVQQIFHSVDGIVILHLESIVVNENGGDSKQSPDEVSSALSLKNILTEFSGSSQFTDNYVSAMRVVSCFSYILSGTTLVFERNIGKRGGALYVEGSSPAFFIMENVTIVFRDNMAFMEGGALYIGDPPYTDISLQPLSYFDCVVNIPPLSNQDFLASGIRFEFYSNTAPVGGLLYGTTLELCSWSSKVDTEGDNLLSYLHDHHNSTFYFDSRPVGKDQVSTRASRIEVDAPGEVIPGEEVDISIDVFDKFDNEIYAVVTSEVHNSSSASSDLGDSGFWYTSINNTTVRIFGPQNQTIDVSYFTFGEAVRMSYQMDLLSCPLGFEFEEESGACECAKEVFEHSHSEVVQCDPLTVTISTTSDHWVGTELHLINTTDLNNLFIHDCHFDYCELNTTFRPPDYDAQCKADSHRTGVLCGACSEGYSVVFGTNECKMCSNYFLFTIIGFAAAGILVFLAIAFLEFTIDKGWLYAALFYCNIVTLYSFTAFPHMPKFQLILLPAHLLSLQVGYGLCFFDGMTALHRSFIGFAFPLYLHMLMLIFGLLSKRYSLSCYFSPAKTFLTIIILCYVSLLNTCLEILAGHIVHTIRGAVSVRWVIDANQLFFRDWHAFLGVIAFVITIGYLGVFTILILFPPVVYRFVKSGKPLYDALYAPFKQKFRFWIGLRLIVRAVIIAIAKFEVTSISLVVNLLLLVILLHIQTNIQPYKNKLLNVVDSFLISNVIILFIGTLAKLQVTFPTDSLLNYTIFYSCFFLGIAYVVIAFILGLHIDSRFPKIRVQLTKWFRKLASKKFAKSKQRSLREIRRNKESRVTTTSFRANAEQSVSGPVVPLSRLEAAWDNGARGHYRDSILDTM